MATTKIQDESDKESTTSSSLTMAENSTPRSWMSSTTNLSFSSSRRTSISTETPYNFSNSHKPHKSNQIPWELIKKLRVKTGQIKLEHFRLLRRVGGGDIGNVYVCEIRNPIVISNWPENYTMSRGLLPQCFYAMKVVDKEALIIRKKLQRAEMEKEILGIIDHPFLPTLYAQFEASHYSCLVMEYCPGGDLHAARQRQPGKRFSISSAKFYAAEILLALEYLHMMGIVYRDLKPENVLVRADGHIMLSDFDLSFKCEVIPTLIKSKPKPNDQKNTSCISKHSYCSLPIQPVLSCFLSPKIEQKKVEIQDHNSEIVAEPINARSRSFVGTHEYLAPEVISGQGHGSAVDWWTLGVFLYELIFGTTPFKGENNEKTLVNILKKSLTFPRIGISSTSKEYEEMVKVQDLISRLLVKNPKKRIGSLKGSVEIKRHDFFKGVNWALIRSIKPPEIPSDHLVKLKSARNAAAVIPKLSKKQREEPYQIPQYFDYF
ncbi:protein kinase PINOID 2-like [Nicotiana tabacum]|uniref:Protein kinase PINOID 2-like n=1 Tax=Nicotiana tabacum TaxID=4097 RepID=A0AC58TMZ4_TOBAC|nr:protein kinase PINOID 2 [Nicotiana tomentosiformis]